MAELTCQCLNVTVHLDNKEVKFGTAVKPSDLQMNIKKSSTFEQLYEVNLGVAGITVAHSCLMQTYESGDWIVHKCANCNTNTHVVHRVKGDSKVFVTDKIETDSSKIHELWQSRKFSTVFNVVLNEIPTDEVETAERQRVFSMSFGNKDPVMKQLHQQMKSFLNDEEVALEQRILKYEKEQREAFAQLRSKAHKERGLLFRSLAKARASALSEAATEDDQKRQEQTHSVTEVIKSGPSLLDHGTQSPSLSHGSSGDSSPGRQPQVTTITLEDKPVITKDQGFISEQDSFDDALFGLDGFNEDDQPANFIQSDDDDESVSTDDSYREELTHSSLTHSSQPVNVAHSLPISVPMFRSYSNQQQQPTEYRDEKVHIAPSQMAASIKALALSVHQETEMFGDLPKPRTNNSEWAR
ncbi:uncharacterized protein [Dysidea avara]|uniref:uncharacterized protein n=1 Tax=Dysidea avara TaxID=196820 RepID=UPI00332DFCA0